MLIPPGIESLSIDSAEIPLGPYPPLGFIPVFDAALGNGDFYGLYWCFGREDEGPVICDLFHDEGRMEPVFPSVASFVEWLRENDWERGETEFEDDEFAPSLYQQARQMIAAERLETALETLHQACEQMPEVSAYWYARSSLERRLGRIEEAAASALRALQANWVFGLPGDQVLRALRYPQYREILADDPLVARIDEFSLGFGGVKLNPVYPLMKECAALYLERGETVAGLLLDHNHACMMVSETGSFQRRYDFLLEDWQSGFTALCRQHLGDDRICRELCADSRPV